MKPEAFVVMMAFTEWHYYGPETGSVEETRWFPTAVLLSEETRDQYINEYDGTLDDVQIIEVEVLG